MIKVIKKDGEEQNMKENEVYLYSLEKGLLDYIENDLFFLFVKENID